MTAAMSLSQNDLFFKRYVGKFGAPLQNFSLLGVTKVFTWLVISLWNYNAYKKSANWHCYCYWCVPWKKSYVLKAKLLEETYLFSLFLTGDSTGDSSCSNFLHSSSFTWSVTIHSSFLSIGKFQVWER